MATASEIGNPPNTGRLSNNAMMVGMLQSALSRMDSSFSTLPDLLLAIDSEGSWREFKFPDSPKVHRWNAAQFRAFIEAPRPSGCETPIAILRRAVEGTDAWETFERLIRGERGGLQHEQRDGAGRFHNRNTITVVDEDSDQCSDTIPFSPDPPRVRDYARESKQGTSVSYALRCLERGVRNRGPARPDLLERVKSGDLSPNAAMVAAGFRDKAITIPADPSQAARRLLLHFQGEALNALIFDLVAAAGLVVVAKEGGDR